MKVLILKLLSISKKFKTHQTQAICSLWPCKWWRAQLAKLVWSSSPACTCSILIGCGCCLARGRLAAVEGGLGTEPSHFVLDTADLGRGRSSSFGFGSGSLEGCYWPVLWKNISSFMLAFVNSILFKFMSYLKSVKNIKILMFIKNSSLKLF